MNNECLFEAILSASFDDYLEPLKGELRKAMEKCVYDAIWVEKTLQKCREMHLNFCLETEMIHIAQLN